MIPRICPVESDTARYYAQLDREDREDLQRRERAAEAAPSAKRVLIGLGRFFEDAVTCNFGPPYSARILSALRQGDDTALGAAIRDMVEAHADATIADTVRGIDHDGDIAAMLDYHTERCEAELFGEVAA